MGKVLQVPLILPLGFLLIVALIKCCMRQIEQIRSHPVRLTRMADGIVHSWEYFPASKREEKEGFAISGH